MSTKQIRRRFSGEFKVVVEALKERRSLAELSQKYEVSHVMISRRNSEFLEAGPLVLSKAKSEDTKTLGLPMRNCTQRSVVRRLRLIS